MSTSIGALNILMSANTATLQSDFSRAAEIARRGGNDMKASMLDAANAAQHGFKGVADSIGLLDNPIARSVAGMGAMGLAIGAVAGAGYIFSELVVGAVDMAEKMADMSIKTGLSVESLSRFSTVAKLSGTDMSTVAGLMKKLSISASEATTGNKNLESLFNSLGISTRELKTLAPDELMTRFAKSLEGLDYKTLDTTLKTLGGKSASEAKVFLQELNERFDETHAKISTQFASDAKEFNDNITIMTSKTKYLGVAFASALLPQLNLVIDAFNRASANGQGFFSSMGAMISEQNVINSMASEGKFLSKYKESIESVNTEMKTASGKRLSDLQDMLRVLETYQKKQVTSLVPETDTDKSSKVSSALGLKNNSAGTGFIEGLQAQIKKIDEGKYAMLSLQAAEKGVAKEAEPLIATLKKLDEGRSAKLYENSLERQNSDISYQISLVGRTSQEVEILNVAHRNQLNLQQQIDQLTKTNGELSLETIKRMTLATEEATNRQISSIERRQNSERGWGVGTSKALNDYAYNASNAASSASTVFSNGFRNMEDAVAKFAMTGQISFSSFANSVVSDLIRIQARAAISGIAGGLGQYFGVGGYGSATEGSSNFIGPPAALANAKGNAKGNAFFGGKVTAFARGGVVSGPTMFPMANGAGLMGEAGPEAVMPLARDSSGRLGVRGGGSGGGNVTVNVVNQASNASATSTETTDSMGNRQIEILVASLVNKTISTGRADQSMKQAYNLRRVGK